MSADDAAYEAVLQDLKRQQAKIQAAITALTALRPPALRKASVVGNGAASIANGNEGSTGEYAGFSIIDASMMALRKAAKPQHVSEIVKVLVDGGVKVSGDKANTVGSILNRRARERGDVHRVGRGTWALESPGLQLGSEAEANQADFDVNNLLG